jgi:RNA-directed DNA polymerase
VRDGVVRRAIDKWLKAGVLEQGMVSHPESGTPQGGVISPLLANIYLHEVLDKWFEEQVKPRLEGRSFAIRYADDFVLVFSSENDARRVLEILPKRFGKFGLTLHPEKTRLVQFGRPMQPGDRETKDRPSRPDTFDLLGFTHYWGWSWRGKWVLKRQTMQGRFSRAMKSIASWCQLNRHQKLAAQHTALVRKVRGHYAYYGITGNARALARFVAEVERTWRKWLGRRSQRARMNWERFHRLLQRYPLPRPRIVHSVYPAAKP